MNVSVTGSSAADGGISEPARRYTMVVLAVVYMFNFIDRQLPAILLPAIRAEFQVSDALLGMLVGTYFALFYATLGVPIALLADRWNRRNLIALALAVWSGMTALSGLAQNFWQLALARIGVGIGEAGCSPPAHSMISDLYPPERRSTAMGFYTLGISAGIMLAYVAGGWVVENIGWREAFFVVGIPGLVLALVVRLTIAEPERGASEQRADAGHRPSILAVFRFLVRRPSFLHMATGAGLSAFVGYSVINWFPSFLVRSFEMSVSSIGVWLGLIVGIAGGAGFFAGGYFADRIGRVRQRNGLRFIAAIMFIASVTNIAVFLAPSPILCLLLLIAPVLLSNVYLAPVLAQTQSLVALRMRGVASALVLLIINIIGLACGPYLTGELSDLLRPRFEEQSMRYALLAICLVVLPWASVHFWLASRSIEHDLARATEQD